MATASRLMAMDVRSGNQEFRNLHAFPFLSSRLDCQGRRDIGASEGEMRDGDGVPPPAMAIRARTRFAKDS
jgi:hypothetical protein